MSTSASDSNSDTAAAAAAALGISRTADPTTNPPALDIAAKLGVDTDVYADRVALVTGGSSGIGIETVRTLAALNMIVYMPVRDRAKASAVVSDIERSHPQSKGRLHLLDLDLESLASVRDCAAAFLKEDRPLQLLILNAGVMATPEGKTKDGFEIQFGSNHLAHYLLGRLLLPALLRAQSDSKGRRLNARVVTLSSSGHALSPILFGDYNLTKRDGGYQRFVAYGQSKTANIYFANELERRYGDKGVRALSVHPGVIMSGLMRHMTTPLSPEELELFGLTAESMTKMAWKTPQQGAATTIWAALNPQFEKKGGVFCEDVSVAAPKPEGTNNGLAGYAAWAYNPEGEKKLWEDSAEMVGLPKED